MDCSNIDPKLMKALLSDYAPIEALAEFINESADNYEQYSEDNVGD